MLSGFAGAKAVRRTLMKLSPGVNFFNVLRTAFTSAGPEIAQKHSQVVSLFCAFGICACKSYW